MGLFDDAGIDADELDSGLADGKHPAVLSAVERKDVPIKRGEEETRPQLVWVYMVDGYEFPLQKFFPILEGKKLSDCDDTDDSFNTYSTARGEVRQTERAYWKSQYRSLKMWVIGHGVAEEHVNSVNPADLVNTRVLLSTKRNAKGYANPVGVTAPGASGATLPTTPAPTANPATSASVTATASAPSAPTGTAPITNPFAAKKV